MKTVNIKGTPPAATNYQLDDGRIYRILLFLLTPESALATADDVSVETRGYEVTQDGSFVIDDNGEPITLPNQRARIPMANVRNGSATMKAGWNAQNLPEEEDDEAYKEATAGARKLKKLPSEGEVGEKVLVDGTLYVYELGLYETIRQMRLQEVKPQEPDVPAETPEDVKALLPY
jgi:hypothetical protein